MMPWEKVAIIHGLLLLLTQSLSPALAAQISVKGKEIGKANGSCTTSLPDFALSASTFLMIGKSNEIKRYGTCPISIFFSGAIDAVSMSTLKAVSEAAIEKASASLVLLNLNSEGGDVWEALAFAKYVRDKDYRYLLMNVAEGDSCFSSCVLILAGGYKRLVSGEVGIHRPYFSGTRANEMGYADLKVAYDSLRAKLEELFTQTNISARLLDDMWQIPSHEIRKLSASQLESYGLSRDDAVLTEKENTELRAVCGANAPVHQNDWYERVLTPCLDAQSTIDIECVNERGSRHPYCGCVADANPGSGFVCY